MKAQSIIRKLVITVLLLEFFSGIVLIGAAALYERHIQLQAFDVMLRGRAYALLGAVQEADDEQDNVMFDMTGLNLPERDLFNVDEDGHVLGQSQHWPDQEIVNDLNQANANGIFRTSLNDHGYRFIVVHGVRVIDPGAKNGGVTHRIRVIYGAPTGHLWHQVLESIRFNSIMTLLLLAVTAGALTWFLSRALAPLKELAEEAGRISAQQWSFHPPESAYTTLELVPLINALKAALDRLQEAFSQQRRFTSNAAHELKTDIAIAKSSIQLLSMRQRTTDEYQRGLEVCLNDCLRLEETIQRMLTLARVESAASPAEAKDAKTSTSNAATCVRESVIRLSSFAELSSITVKVEAPEEVAAPLTEGDCTLLFTNLIHNALLHSKQGSIVSILVHSSEEWTSFQIEDHGDGIHPDILPYVFEPFYRGDSSRDRRTGGTGLGLAICKALCEGVGGNIAIASQTGKGTMVTVHLPLRKLSLASDSKASLSLANAD
jgi:signal transduction histidine kinase